VGKSIDIVFVSNSYTSTLWEMTAMAIRSAVYNAGMPIKNVLITEQCRHARDFFAPGHRLIPYQLKEKYGTSGRTLYYDNEFNYNWCLNLGRSLCNSEYMAFCNNDLYFEPRWAVHAITAMEKYGYLSASPNNRRNSFQGVREGYKIGTKGQLLGWCIITHKKVFDYIGQFDMPVRFWYSDNVYGVQLQCAGIKHALIGNSKVRHLESTTLRKIPVGERAKLMRKQKKAFDKYKIKKYAIASSEIEAEAGNGN